MRLPRSKIVHIDLPMLRDDASLDRWVEQEAAKYPGWRGLLEAWRAYYAAIEKWRPLPATGPCPHGATFEELRAALPVPVHHKRAKHLRDYLLWATTLDFVRVEIVAGEGRYLLGTRAALLNDDLTTR